MRLGHLLQSAHLSQAWTPVSTQMLCACSLAHAEGSWVFWMYAYIISNWPGMSHVVMKRCTHCTTSVWKVKQTCVVQSPSQYYCKRCSKRWNQAFCNAPQLWLLIIAVRSFRSWELCTLEALIWEASSQPA